MSDIPAARKQLAALARRLEEMATALNDEVLLLRVDLEPLLVKDSPRRRAEAAPKAPMHDDVLTMIMDELTNLSRRMDRQDAAMQAPPG